MIRFSNLSLYQGHKLLFQNADLQIHFGHKVGVIGKNGCGKSSLFNLVKGTLHQETGDIEVPKDWKIASVEQEIEHTERLAIDYVLDGFTQYRDLQRQLEQAHIADDGMEAAHIMGQLQDIGADTLPTEAAIILSGLGFSVADQKKSVNQFSGGWQMRLNLARALLYPSDMLLLDEPTNHLDLDTVIWLERWLQSYQGTLLLISHDRDFIDSICGHILSFEDTKLFLYKGNYSGFEKQQAERIRQQQLGAVKQQQKAAHLQKFIDRFGAKASKAKQANSRKKQLEKLVDLIPYKQESEFSFEFLAPDKLPNPLIQMQDLNLGYEDKTVITKVQLNLQVGSRIGLLGKNGAGKSTLIKSLAGVLAPKTGVCKLGNGLKVGYFHQHTLEQLDLNLTPLQHLQRIAPKATEQSLRDFLGGFNFIGDTALSPIGPFSGGEKARLALAGIVFQKPNLLLLDEPTNHLDMMMRDAINLALQDFNGALVLVSHDRFLMSTVCDDYYLVDNQQVQPFNGDMSDYQAWILQAVKEDNSEKTSAKVKDRKEQKRIEAEFRQSINPIKQQVSKLEKQIEKLQQQLQEVESELAGEALYQEEQKTRLLEVLQTQTNIKNQLDELETEWMERVEEIELATAEFEKTQ